MKPPQPRPCKLLAIDLDGTLLDSHNQLPPKNRDALHRAHEAGLKICLTTGRSFTEARPVLDSIGLDLDVAILTCGAIVSDPRTARTLHASPLHADTLERIASFFADRDFSFLLTHDVSTAGFDYSVIRRARWGPAYDRWFEMVPCDIREVPDWRGLPQRTYRLTLLETSELYRAIRPELARHLPPDLTKHNAIYVAPYDVHVLEFFAPHVHKWSALELLCRDYGIDAAEVVAIGDAINDLEMIRHAGLSFAVANACHEVRAAATHTVPSNDDHGAAIAIHRIL